MAQATVFVQKGAAGKSNTFGDGGRGDLAAPSFDNLSGRHAVRQLVEDLPDHDASALEGGFAVADQGVGDDMFAEFEAFVRASFHAYA